jgi:hypothetical protein
VDDIENENIHFRREEDVKQPIKQRIHKSAQKEKIPWEKQKRSRPALSVPFRRGRMSAFGWKPG